MVEHAYEPNCNGLTQVGKASQKVYPQEIERVVNSYEVLILCTPIWWCHIAPATLSFLHDIDTKDKIVIPFLIHGGYGTANDKELYQICPDARIPWMNRIPFHMRKMEISFEELNHMVKRISPYEWKKTRM